MQFPLEKDLNTFYYRLGLFSLIKLSPASTNSLKYKKKQLLTTTINRAKHAVRFIDVFHNK